MTLSAESDAIDPARQSGYAARLQADDVSYPIYEEVTVSTESIPHDVAIIGSGPGGEGASMQASKLGKRVAVVERDMPLPP